MTADTVDAVRTYVGDRVLVLVDEAGWPTFENFKIPGAEVVKGLRHAHRRGPYRNYALGLKWLNARWPESDWYLYCEYDVLFASAAFKQDLEQSRAWCVGVDLRRFPFEFPLLEDILGRGPIRDSYYLLGCCQFHHRDFITRLAELDFFDRLLERTAGFERGFFPGYDRWAFEEELWPTLAAHLGGRVHELSCWKGGTDHHPVRTGDPRCGYSGRDHDDWRGRFKRYPVRNSPEVDLADLTPEVSIAHPVKAPNCPVRQFLRSRRSLL